MKAWHKAHAIASYAGFVAVSAWAVGFIGVFLVPRSIDASVGTDGAMAVAIDCALLGLFGLQHSVMARPAFKRWWTRIVPVPVERGTYVLATTLALALLFAAWQPLPSVVWDASGTSIGTVLWVLFWIGWIVTVLSTFMISHAELFGLAQAWSTRDSGGPPVVRIVQLYRFVRHPIMLGFLIAFWSAPVMTLGHLLFAGLSSAYIVVGVALEERDQVALFGEAYRRYRREVPMLLPFPGRRRRED